MKKRNRKRRNILVPILYKDRRLMELLLRGYLNDEGCLIWRKNADKNGYGMTTFTENKIKKSWRVTRLIWTLVNGPIPENMLICHRCDNPKCFNLDHLFLGTHQDNSLDREIKGRSRVQIGEKNHQSKLTSSDVLLIRKLRNEGIPAKELANIFKIHPSHVTRLMGSTRWSHI
ncbi:HNH endonuclease [Methylobacter sp.]|uniref:HNH endonuclease n=1 Tax=Methylobacter sp. TaxID=2051955 RepID=UPI003DA4618C